MKPEKIEDAHNFKRMLIQDCGLTNSIAKVIHESYQSFINENYVLKTEITHLDHILNKSESQI